MSNDADEWLNSKLKQITLDLVLTEKYDEVVQERLKVIEKVFKFLKEDEGDLL